MQDSPVIESSRAILLQNAVAHIQRGAYNNLFSLVHIAVNLMFAPASGVEPLMPFSLGHSPPVQDSPVMPILLTALLIYPRSVYNHLWPAPGLSLNRNTRYTVSAYIRVFSWPTPERQFKQKLL